MIMSTTTQQPQQQTDLKPAQIAGIVLLCLGLVGIVINWLFSWLFWLLFIIGFIVIIVSSLESS